MAIPTEDLHNFVESIREIHRNEFLEGFIAQLQHVQINQEFVNATGEHYEQEYLRVVALLETKERNRPQPGTSRARLWVAEVTELRAGINREGQVLDHIRSWKSYMDEWITALIFLQGLWRHIFETYDRSLTGSVQDNDLGEYRKALQNIQARVAWASAGCRQHGDAVLATIGI